MRLEVDYIDPQGNQTIQYLDFSKLAFIKHMAIAGQKYQPKWIKASRFLGMFLVFREYFQKGGFEKNRFTTPSILGYDPTEQAHFSNLAGKAIADFLSKRLSGCNGTFSYEAAMKIKGMPIKGNRPDFIAHIPYSQSFAIEAKGLSMRAVNMGKYYDQALSGPIKVNFAVASISYNIYQEIRCNYHVQENKNVKYDYNLFRELSKQYYSGLLEYMNESTFIISTVNMYKENFFKLKFRLPTNPLLVNFLGNIFSYHKFLEFFEEFITRFYILLPGDIQAFSNSGLPENYLPFINEIASEKVYIDIDRVGVGFDEVDS